MRRGDNVAEIFHRCASEALTAFGDARLYAQTFMADARHIEVQIAGDGQNVIHLHERD